MPTKLAGIAVVALDDYLSSETTNANGKKQTIDLPKANVLRFHLEDGSTVAVRPSGTEPKIKYYFSVNASLDSASNYSNLREELNTKCQQLINVFTL